MEKRRKREISIPDYTLGEEIFNAVSHGVGALLGVAALVLMVIRAHGALAEVAVSIFGAAMIQLYTISCVYHALSRRLNGKKVMRVIDHCNVYLLVLGTYVPVSLLGVGAARGWELLGIVLAFSVLGIVFTAIDVDRYQVVSVLCHLASGWSILLGIPGLRLSMGRGGLVCLILGGVMYSIGAILYALGRRKRYSHSIFHLFCILGTFFHFWCVYAYLL